MDKIRKSASRDAKRQLFLTDIKHTLSGGGWAYISAADIATVHGVDTTLLGTLVRMKAIERRRVKATKTGGWNYEYKRTAALEMVTVPTMNQASNEWHKKQQEERDTKKKNTEQSTAAPVEPAPATDPEPEPEPQETIGQSVDQKFILINDDAKMMHDFFGSIDSAKKYIITHAKPDQTWMICKPVEVVHTSLQLTTLK